MLPLIAIIFLIILVIGHELGHFFAAKLFKLRVEEFGFGFPPRIASKKKGETRYSFNALPFGGFVKIYGEDSEDVKEIKDTKRSFFHQKAWKRALIVVAGALMNFLIGWIAFAFVLSNGIPGGVIVESIIPESPAAIAGFEQGEVLGDFGSAEEFIAFIDKNKGKEVLINEKAIVPRVNPPEGEGSLGITIIETGAEKQNPIFALGNGFVLATDITFEIGKGFISLIKGLFIGDFELAKEVTGPVGVYNILGQTSKLGASALIQLLGIISLNLVVINLIPFPALDGGRLLFIGLEKVFGKRVNQKIELAVNGFGILLLLLFMVLVTIRDVANVL